MRRPHPGGSGALLLRPVDDVDSRLARRPRCPPASAPGRGPLRTRGAPVLNPMAGALRVPVRTFTVWQVTGGLVCGAVGVDNELREGAGVVRRPYPGGRCGSPATSRRRPRSTRPASPAPNHPAPPASRRSRRPGSRCPAGQGVPAATVSTGERAGVWLSSGGPPGHAPARPARPFRRSPSVRRTTPSARTFPRTANSPARRDPARIVDPSPVDRFNGVRAAGADPARTVPATSAVGCLARALRRGRRARPGPGRCEAGRPIRPERCGAPRGHRHHGAGRPAHHSPPHSRPMSPTVMRGARRGGTRPLSRISRAARCRWPAYGSSRRSISASSAVRSPASAQPTMPGR